MFTVTFKSIGKTAYDVRNIVLCNSNGVVMDDTADEDPAMRCRGDVFFQKINPTTGLMKETTYDYNTKKAVGGWEEDSSGEPIEEGACTFASGEGIYINNDLGEDVMFQFSGEVELTPFTMPLIPGYSIVGNPTPLKIDLTKVRLYNSNKVEMDDTADEEPAMRCRGDVFFQKINGSTGLMKETTYDYNTKKAIGGWEEDSSGEPIPEGTVFLEPGESVYLNNDLGETVYLKFPSPVEK